MNNTSLPFFEAFYKAIPSVTASSISSSTTALLSDLKDLDPIAANELIQDQLQSIHPDNQLLELFDAIIAFQYQNMGELYEFEEAHPFVLATTDIARRLSGKNNPPLSFLPKLLDALESALADRDKLSTLKNYEQRLAKDLLDYRLKMLEAGSSIASQLPDIAEEEKTFGEFTHSQQAIAIHYLFQEALGIAGIDNTKLMEFAHLLSAKKLAVSKETGKANIRNSGIKSAFNKAWKKQDANHLADLKFVLRFFKPLNVDGASGIGQAVAAIESRIARISEKLTRDRD